MLSLRSLARFPVRAIRYSLRPARRLGQAAGAGSGFWARFYYAFFDPAFGREQRSFLAGRQAYAELLTVPSGSVALIRRNVHRLEKGLLMRPRRVPFAVDYIGETVDAYATAAGVCGEGRGVDPEEMAWAADVLAEYFQIHGAEPKVTRWAEAFAAASPSSHSAPPPRTPYLRNLGPSPVSYEALAELAKRRRSVRWFLQQPVERELIDKALELGVQAPSACNRQPFEFRIFDDRELVQKVINIPFGLAGYGHNVPVVAVVIGQQRHYFDERDRHLIYIDASLAIMGFLFALETLGLSSCCVNWPDVESNERKMATLLNLAPDERPVMCLAIGYPDPEGMVASSTKKSLSQLRRYNFE